MIEEIIKYNCSITKKTQNKKRPSYWTDAFGLCRHYLFSRAASSQVSSAQMSLTTVFGMGTGGPSSQSTPTHETVHLVNARDILTEQNTNCKHFFHFFYKIFNFVNFQQKDTLCNRSQGENEQEKIYFFSPAVRGSQNYFL